jgi:NADH dehydrogenase
MTKHAVTGAFGFTGRYIARLLISKGIRVINLTNSPERANTFGLTVSTRPLDFENPKQLVESLTGISVLYNTYWVRFNHKLFSFRRAIENTQILFDSAKKAGVTRIVHVSITNPAENSDLEYFSGKAVIEKTLEKTELSYAILRPAVIFGSEDILINNIAWMIRKLPILGVFGDGQYRLQPIYVEDLADLAVLQGANRENVIIDAIGPETFTYEKLVKRIANILGIEKPIISISPRLGYWLGRFLGLFVGDVVITQDEIKGLMDELLYVESPPVGKTRLSEWALQNRTVIGLKYASELRRRTNK